MSTTSCTMRNCRVIPEINFGRFCGFAIYRCLTDYQQVLVKPCDLIWHTPTALNLRLFTLNNLKAVLILNMYTLIVLWISFENYLLMT